MRLLECLKSAEKVLHGNSFLWSMMSSQQRMCVLSHITAAKVTDVKTSLPDCAGLAADAASGCTQSEKWRTLQH